MSTNRRQPLSDSEHESLGDDLRSVETILTARLEMITRRYSATFTTGGEPSKVLRRLRNAVEAVQEVRYATENLMIDDHGNTPLAGAHAYRAPGRD